ANRMQEQVKRLGLDIVWGNTTSIQKKKDNFEVMVDNKTLHSKAIIIATGTEAAKLNIPGEDEFRGKGVSYCATCDGPFYKDKNIFVVGGGNAAIEEAIFLTRFAKKVSVVHRRDTLRADKILTERAVANPKIYFFWHSVVAEIKGEKKVEELVLSDLPTNKKLKVAADGIFVYVGSRPNSALVKDNVKLNKHGYIITDENMQTSIKGIWAAGDVREKSLRQVVTAAADGAIAAEAARKFIEEDHQK
ncbi:MAG: FAD-dependent oxidoreductase, partial [bacterium]